MNGYWLTLGIVAAFVLLVVVVTTIKMIENVRIAKHTGTDPRVDQELRSEAQRKVRGS